MQWKFEILQYKHIRKFYYKENLPVKKHIFTAISLFMGMNVFSAPLPEGGYFYNKKQIDRFREQQSLPLLEPAYQSLKKNFDRAKRNFCRKFPAAAEPLSTGELISRGTGMVTQKKYERAVIFLVPDYPDTSMQLLLDNTPENRELLREMLLTAIGIRRKFNMWREYGIHEAENTVRFLKAYDIALQLGALRQTDIDEIRSEMNRIAHNMEGWLMDNEFSRMYEDYRLYNYCINFHIVAAVALNAIANIFPELPDAQEWKYKSHAALLGYMIDGNTEDGGYGEGSINYWSASGPAFEFIHLNKNMGNFDYSMEPFWRKRFTASLNWRANTTSPDGLTWAIGDGHRTAQDVNYLLLGGELFNVPEILWVADKIIQNAPQDALRPGILFHYNAGAEKRKPGNDSNLFLYAGYAMLRSGWTPADNALFFKYGPTYTGRRQAERNAVISGHAHQDALSFELHHKGRVVLADIGTRGRYSDWYTYGGFMKATVGHSTVGLGNIWGYDRLDGKYREHLKKHMDFTYERPQQNIGAADTRTTAFADLKDIAVAAARVNTYPEVVHERGIIWFPQTSFTVVADRMQSSSEQPYEWYFTPVGKALDGEKLIFGDDTAKLQILPLTESDKITVITRETGNIPEYYVDLAPETTPVRRKPQPRWDVFSLAILSKKAANTDFINVLMPFAGEKNDWISGKDRYGNNTFTQKNQEITVVRNGLAGAVRKVDGKITDYAVLEGTELKCDNRILISSRLENERWKERYNPAVNGVVNLTGKTAYFECKRRPGEEHLEFYPPRLVEGQEAELPIKLKISFYVPERPEEVLIGCSLYDDLKFDDERFARKTAMWPKDIHSNRLIREKADFQYDDENKILTVTANPITNKIIWR